MNSDIFTTALEVQNYLLELGREFCFIGGVANLRWGEARITKDVDLTVLCPWGDESQLIDEVFSKFSMRMADAVTFAERSRVILANSLHNNFPIDIAIGSMPYEENCVNRASFFEYAKDINLLTCSAEDLIITKAFAGRNRDWMDIESILIRQPLNWKLIQSELVPLLELKEAPENYDQLMSMKKKFGRHE